MSASSEAFISFEEMDLHVGDRLQLVSILDEKKVISYSNLIGFDANNGVFTKLPQANGNEIPLHVGQQLDVVIFSGDSIYNFSCSVDEIYLGIHQFVALSFPQKIHATRLRRHPRARVDLPVSVHSIMSGQVDAIASDLSISGALLECENKLGEVGQDIELTITIKAKATRREITIVNKATIRNKQEIEKKRSGRR